MRSITHFELMFVYIVWGKGLFIYIFFLCGYPITPALFVEKSILAPLNYFGTFVKSVNCICMGLFVDSVFFSTGKYLFVHQYHPVLN